MTARKHQHISLLCERPKQGLIRRRGSSVFRPAEPMLLAVLWAYKADAGTNPDEGGEPGG